MKSEQEYHRDLQEIRSMMERSTKFLSLTGWSGIMAGIYALAGSYIAYRYFYLNNDTAFFTQISSQEQSGDVLNLVLIAIVILVLAVGTAIFLSWKKSKDQKENIWNSAARRLLVNMAIPLVTGGIFILILFSKGLFGLSVPATMIFYGLALLNASKFTFEEIKSLGIIQIALGLLATYFIDYALLFWALGFGAMHIAYGIYMHLKHEK